MPEIIKRGKTRDEKVIGFEFRCYTCGTVYKLVEGDDYRYREATEQRDNDSVELDCPVCGTANGKAVPGTQTW